MQRRMLAKFEAQRSKKPLCTDAGLFKFYTSRRSHRHTISYELFQGVAPSLWQKFDDLVSVTTWNPDLALSRLVVPAALFPQAFISNQKSAMFRLPNYSSTSQCVSTELGSASLSIQFPISISAFSCWSYQCWLLPEISLPIRRTMSILRPERRSFWLYRYP